MLAGRYPEIGQVLPEAEANVVPVCLVSLVDDLLQVPAELRPQNTHEVRRRLRDVSRGLPLALHASVADVATPFFRAETPGELPPDIPLELIEKGPVSWSRRRHERAELCSPRARTGRSGIDCCFDGHVGLGMVVSAVANSARDIEIMDPEFVADGAAQGVLRIYPDAIRAAIATGVREESVGVVLGAAERGANTPPSARRCLRRLRSLMSASCRG